MIELHTWPTPNGHKIHIMLEETGTPYNVHPVDIGAGDQFKPEFLKISPNNKMPAMVDTDGPGGKPFALAESGAMLFYLASKTGRFLPEDLRERWQGANIGEFPALKRWRDGIAQRPAVLRALQVLADRRRAGPHTEREREVLFG